MTVCRDGIRAGLEPAAILILLLASSLFLQTPSVAAEDPSADENAAGREVAPLDEPVPESLAFVTEGLEGVRREGHVELLWNDIGAVEYVVYQQDGNAVYRGRFPQAFISGLSDGEYAFLVRGVDQEGNVLAVSEEPAIVKVEHWPLVYAWASFAVGAVIFLALIGVIVGGALASRRERSSSSVEGN